MDVVAMLVEKAKQREQDGWLPINENPAKSDSVETYAVFMLYYYFENRIVPGNDWDTMSQYLAPYRNTVIAAWQEGRNMRSIRLIAILADELFHNMPYYLADVISDLDRFQYARSAAQQLGIENDWPELRPPQSITQRRRVPTGLDADPNYAAKIAGLQIQQTMAQNRINNR